MYKVVCLKKISFSRQTVITLLYNITLCIIHFSQCTVQFWLQLNWRATSWVMAQSESLFEPRVLRIGCHPAAFGHQSALI